MIMNKMKMKAKMGKIRKTKKRMKLIKKIKMRSKESIMVTENSIKTII